MHKFEFFELIGDIDDELIERAGKEWKDKKRRVHFGSLGVKIACACMIIVVLLGSIFPTEARAVWEKFTTRIGQILGITQDLEKYTEHKDISATKNSLTMTLREVILDQDEILLLVSWSGEDKKPLSEDLFIEGDIWIDGYKLDYGPSAATDVDATGAIRDSVITFDIDEGMTIRDNVEVKTVLRVVNLNDMDTVIADFSYNFTASKEELEKSTKTISLNQTIKEEGIVEMKLTSLKINAVNSRITGICHDLLFDREYALKGKDDRGNEVTFDLLMFDISKLLFVKRAEEIIAPEAKTLELQLYMRIVEGELVGITDYGEVVAEERFEEVTNEYEPIGEKFEVRLEK